MTTIACMGDSVTAGSPYYKNVTTPPNKYQDIYAWTSTVRNELNINVINKGIGGQTTGEMLARFDNDVINSNPDYCIIEGGINDVLQVDKYVPFYKTQINIQSMIAKCQMHNIIPILATPIPTRQSNSFSDYQHSEIDVIRNWLTEYGKLVNITVIDFYNPLIQNITGNVIMSLISDGLHPNLEGYKRLGFEVIKQLRDIVIDLAGTKNELDKKISFYGQGQAPRREYTAGEVIFNNVPSADSFSALVCSISGSPGSFLTSGGNLRNLDSVPLNSVGIYYSDDNSNKYWHVNDIMLISDNVNKELNIFKVVKNGWTGGNHINTPDMAITKLMATLSTK